MQTDLNAAPHGGEGDGTGATGLTPEQQEIKRLKDENAQLRDERRQDRAKALGAEHKLTPSMVELIAGLPSDQQEARAKALADEIKGLASSTPAQDAAPAASQPPPVQEPPADPSLAALDGSSGAPPPVVPNTAEPDWMLSMKAEVDEAQTKGDFESLQKIQEKYQRMVLEANDQ